MSQRLIKLVRDRVGNPNDKVIYQRGPFTDEDFEILLREKLVEEAREFERTGDYSELIDTFEVIWAWVQFKDRTVNELLRDAEEERIKRGSFLNRVGMWIQRPS
jgi:predicted house-cleaning noncanonical NTP pyrophosphatase (MazG superfamily)